jgi:PAS domain-containing protein
LKGQETDGVIQFIRNEKRPEGVFISVTGRPMRDAHSTITGGVVVIRDISRQMEAECSVPG